MTLPRWLPAAVLLGLTYLVLSLWYMLWLAPPPAPSRRFTSLQSLRLTHPTTDHDWVVYMRDAPLHSLVRFKTANSTSFKYLAHFADGGYALCKIAYHVPRPFVQLFAPAPTVPADFTDYETKKSGFSVKREDRYRFQGMPELVSYHLDRLLGHQRRPPVVARSIPAHLFREDSSLMSFLTHVAAWFLVPAYTVEATLQVWVQGLRVRVPDLHHFLLLAHHYPHPTTNAELADLLASAHNLSASLRLPNETMVRDVRREEAGLTVETLRHELRQIGSIFAFSYLADDHDRLVEKNWFVDSSNQWLLIDGGLSWTHGPYGRSLSQGSMDRNFTCRELLCGISKWRKFSTERWYRNNVLSLSTVHADLAAVEVRRARQDALMKDRPPAPPPGTEWQPDMVFLRPLDPSELLSAAPPAPAPPYTPRPSMTRGDVMQLHAKLRQVRQGGCDSMLGCSLGCERICMFPRETVHILRGLDVRTVGWKRSLGFLFKQYTKKDPMFPFFHLASFRIIGHRDPYRFFPLNFFVGMNRRLASLLDHIDDCVARFGEQNVII